MGQIEFDEYLDFYDKKMVDQFDKPVPPEDEKKERPTPPPKIVEPQEVPVPEEERPTPPPKKATLPPQLDKPEEEPDE